MTLRALLMPKKDINKRIVTMTLVQKPSLIKPIEKKKQHQFQEVVVK